VCAGLDWTVFGREADLQLPITGSFGRGIERYEMFDGIVEIGKSVLGFG
jgi:hypothetical protein